MLGVDQLSLVLSQFLQIHKESPPVIQVHLNYFLTSSVEQKLQSKLALLEECLGDGVRDLILGGLFVFGDVQVTALVH